MNLKRYPSKAFLQIVKFIVSGGVSAILEIYLLIFFVDLLYLNYLYANLIVYAIGGPINFLMNKYWVFEKGSLTSYIQVLSFVLLVLLNLGLNQFLLWGLVEFTVLDYKASKVLAIGIAVILNFLIKKYLIFERKTATLTA